MGQRHSIILGSGSYLPTKKVTNEDFGNSEFYDQQGVRLEKTNQVIIHQFEQITGIKERRYVTDDLVTQ